MNYMTIITILYRARNVISRVAKLFAWLFGIQTAILFMLATGADAPLPFTSSPAIRFAVAVAVVYLAPPLINAIIRKLAASIRPA